MSRVVHYDEDAQPYYELTCDGCHDRYRCGDDSCYDWELLREAAQYDGWNAAAPGATGPHHCATCAPVGDVPPAPAIPARPSRYTLTSSGA
jgi:hypothetical protein